MKTLYNFILVAFGIAFCIVAWQHGLDFKRKRSDIHRKDNTIIDRGISEDVHGHKQIFKALRLLYGITNREKTKDITKLLQLERILGYGESIADYIRRNLIIAPRKGEYILENYDTYDNSQRRISMKIDKALGHKTNGFFVECGAGNGEFLSNSLFFERKRNWTGLLIEADPIQFSRLQKKNRHAYSINACLLNETKMISFLSHAKDPNWSGIEKDMEKGHRRALDDTQVKSVDVRCFTLPSILEAINVHQIDYFSLDVEGAETTILKSIPFEKYDIKTLSIEYYVMKDPKRSREKKMEIREIMDDTGLYNELEWDDEIDLFFIKK